MHFYSLTKFVTEISEQSRPEWLQMKQEI